MVLFHLFRTLSWSHIKQERLKVTVTIFGMALGIACYTAIRLANFSAFESFASASRLFTSGSDLSVVNPDGRVPESVIPLLKDPETATLLPYTSRYVEAFRNGASVGVVQVAAVDPFEQPLGADRDLERTEVLRLLKGETAIVGGKVLGEAGKGRFELLINARRIGLQGITKHTDLLADAYGGKVVILDIAVYQRLFADFGTIDRINLKLRPGVEAQVVQKRIQALLQSRREFSGLRVEAADSRVKQGETMTAAFRLNLNFLSAISLLVSLLLIFNSMSYVMLKRSSETGLLKALGCSERVLFRLFILESTLMGLTAAALGAAGGHALSTVLIHAVSTTFSTLYLPVEVTQVRYSQPIVTEALLIGTAVAFLGGLLPALEAGRAAPREALDWQNIETGFSKRIRAAAFAGIALIVCTAVFSRPELLRFSLFAGFIPPLALVAGTVMIIPCSIALACRLCLLLRIALPVEFLLGIDHIRVTLKRNSAAVAAMSIALSMFLGVSMMILSFRHTVELWIRHITTADVFISSAQTPNGEPAGNLPDDLVRYLTELENVRAVDWVASKRITREGRDVRLLGVRFEPIRDFNRLLLKHTPNKETLYQQLSRHDAILISETYANRFGVQIGDTLKLRGLKQDLNFEVVNVFYDYSSEQGTLIVPYAAFQTLDGETRKQGVSLYLPEAMSADEVRGDIEKRFPEYRLLVRDNRLLRQDVLEIFDDTFKVTYALQAIALIISAFSTLNTLLMMLLERQREFAVLRAIGASRRSLVKMICAESGFLGLLALIFGLFAGTGLALLLVFVVNRFFFGWSVKFFFPPSLIISSALWVLALSIGTGIAVGRHTSRKIDSSALRYE